VRSVGADSDVPSCASFAALTRFAAAHSTETVGIARLGLERAIRHARPMI
jgi:hypothetical protein